METNERARELHARVLSARRQLRRAERELALLLAEIADDAHFRALGYVSLAEYAATTLELSPRQTRVPLVFPTLPRARGRVPEGREGGPEIDSACCISLPAPRATLPRKGEGSKTAAQTQTARVIEREVAARWRGTRRATASRSPVRVGRAWCSRSIRRTRS